MALLEIGDQALVDSARGRTVLTRVFAPAAPGRYPTIVFSHGFTRDLSAFNNTARRWAEHGHVVVVPTHADAVAYPDATVDPREADVVRRVLASRTTGVLDAQTRAAWVDVLNNPFYLDSRLADVAFLLRCLRGEGALASEVVERVDLSRLGMAGHSYGAYTTLVIAGARLERDSAAAQDPLLREFKAALAISGQGAGRMFLSDRSFASIRMPLFAITGTRDFGAAEETPSWRQQPFRDSRPGDRFSAIVDGFAHSEFDPAADDPVHGATGEVLRAMQLEYWSAYLSDSSDSRDALKARTAASRAGAAIFVEAR
jgi:dienelactone hydrolase